MLEHAEYELFQRTVLLRYASMNSNRLLRSTRDSTGGVILVYCRLRDVVSGAATQDKVTRVSVGESRQLARISDTIYLILLPKLRQVIKAWHISRYFSSSFKLLTYLEPTTLSKAMPIKCRPSPSLFVLHRSSTLTSLSILQWTVYLLYISPCPSSFPSLNSTLVTLYVRLYVGNCHLFSPYLKLTPECRSV